MNQKETSKTITISTGFLGEGRHGEAPPPKGPVAKHRQGIPNTLLAEREERMKRRIGGPAYPDEPMQTHTDVHVDETAIKKGEEIFEGHKNRTRARAGGPNANKERRREILRIQETEGAMQDGWNMLPNGMGWWVMWGESLVENGAWPALTQILDKF